MSTKVREYGSEFDWASSLLYTDKDFSSHPIKSDSAYRFRSGRDALKAVAQHYSKTHKTVLLPVLCCESMVTPFTMNGYQTVFYKLKKDLTADEEDLKSKVTDTTLLVYMSYFGIEPFSKNFLASLRASHSQVRFIEDRTHIPFKEDKNNDFEPDVVVISIRKWLAIADGGLVFTKEKMRELFPVHCDFSDLRKTAMEKKSEFLQTGNEEIKNEFRALLNEASELLDASPDPYKMTADSIKHLLGMDYEKISEQRTKNVQVLKKGLTPLVIEERLGFVTDIPEKSTLYFPVLVKDRDYLQKVLAEKSVFCPVIWPIPEEAENICPNSEYVAENMLAIPCDQRYGQDDMMKIIEIINSVI